MSKAILLDHEKVALLGPSEKDGQNRYWISPFDVPLSIEIFADPSMSEIRTIRFEYPTGETSRSKRILTQSGGAPELPVHLVCGRISGKILEMTFGVPIAVDALPVLADRLRDLAKQTRAMATRFNYQLIASILDAWPSVAAPDNEATAKPRR